MKSILNKALIAVGIVTAIVIIILLVLGGKKVAAQTALKNSFNNQISTIGLLINGYNLDDLTSILSKNQTTLSLEAKLDTDIEEFSVLNKYKINVKLASDKLNERNIINAVINDDKDKLDVSYFALKNNSYAYIKDTYSKYIDLGSTTEELNSIDSYANNIGNYNESDVSYLLNLISNSILRSITEKDLTISKSTEKIYGKSLDLKVISLTIDNEKYTTITNNIINDLNNDDKAINILATMSNQTTDVVKESIKDAPDFDGKDEIKIYIDDNYNLIKISSELKADIDDVPNKSTIEYICSNEKYTYNYKNLIGSDEIAIVFDNGNKNKKITYNTVKKDVEKNITKLDGKIVFSTLKDENSYNANIKWENNIDTEDRKNYFNIDFAISATNSMDLTVPNILPVNTITIDNALIDPTFMTSIENNSIISKFIGSNQ